MSCIRRLAQSVGLFAWLYVCCSIFILQVFIPIYRGFGRRWEFSRCINLSFLNLWFFTLDLFPDLILVLRRTNFKSIPFPKEQQLLQYSCYSCLDLETSYRESGCRDKCRVSGRTLRTMSFVNSDEGSFWWPLLLMTLLLMTCLQELFFRLVSSDAVLQTHSLDAFFQMLFKLQLNFFALDLFNQNLYEYIFDHDPVYLNKCLAYPIDNF